MKLIGLVIMVVALAFGGGERACAHAGTAMAGAAMIAAHAMDHQGADHTTMDDAASSPIDHAMHAMHSDAPIKGEPMDHGSHDGMAGGYPEDCSEDCPDHCNGGRDCAGCAAVSPAITAGDHAAAGLSLAGETLTGAFRDTTYTPLSLEPPVPKAITFI